MVLFLLAAIRVSGDPEVGAPSTLAVTNNARPRVGISVHAVYQPGSPDQQETAVGATDADGETHWTPLEPGAVAIRAAGQEKVVLVGGDDRAGLAGIGLWALTFTGLLGLFGWSIRRMGA
jgi:hypothetical protein